MDIENENSSRNPVKAILIFMVLFVLPAGALYFLNAGKNFRQDYLKDLSDMGKVATFNLPNQDNLDITPEVLKGKVSIVHFLPEDASAAKANVERISKLHKSFDDTEDVVFLSFVPADSTTSLREEAARLGISDNKQWYLVGAGKENLERMAKENFHLADPFNNIALVDTTLSIRNQYNIGKNDEMGRLVVHISMIIPKQKKRTGM
jgi:cytochrome oxidase Cu insertion factor (SCO1/SenC/PrrC family)